MARQINNESFGRMTGDSAITEAEAKRRIDEMKLIHGFLFDNVMEDNKRAKVVARNIINTVLQSDIRDLKVTSQKSYSGVDSVYHGIRFDVCIESEDMAHGDVTTGTVYDIEMENREADRAELPRRQRYYAALSDNKRLKTGQSYMKLPNYVSITILSYDPFGGGDMYYEAKTMLTTHPDIEYENGILNIFLYAHGKNNIEDAAYGEKVEELLKYIVDGEKKATPSKSVSELDELVSVVKQKKEVTKRLMKSWDYELHLRRDIREELEAEVRQEVRQEVAKEVRQKVVEEVRQEVVEEVRQEVAEEDALNLIRFCHENGVTDDAIRENLADKYGYDDASIDTLFEKAKAPAAKA